MLTFKKADFGKVVKNLMRDGKTFRITAPEEFTDSLTEEFGKPEEVKAKVWELEGGKLIAVDDEVFYVPYVWGVEDENL